MRALKLLATACCFVFLFFSTAAQDSIEVKSNPIIFGEMHIGGSAGNAGGLSLGLAAHYQINNNLFSFRVSSNINSRITIISPFFPFPLLKPKTALEEYAVMFGRRKTNGPTSLSISIGLSYNNFREVLENANNPNYYDSSYYWGFPFEASLKFFKNRKTHHRIFFIIPTSPNPTAFGRSIGLKLFGAASKNSYGGLALTYGLGLHKRY